MQDFEQPASRTRQIEMVVINGIQYRPEDAARIKARQSSATANKAMAPASTPVSGANAVTDDQGTSGEAPTPPAEVPVDEQSYEQLKATADGFKIKYAGNVSKADLVSAIKAELGG